ncbi:MAG: hypothetical protein JW841_14000 [Deltaproteobacteria bacterium]|nr:hypothetical protein [Deltaproteobacteria bacterium]
MFSKRKTVFASYIEKCMKEPAFAKEYAKVRAKIESIDNLVRIFDAKRAAAHLSKV